LLDRHGRGYCEELGIGLETNTPSGLFRWLCAALLFSARISAGLAHRAAKALTEQGWADAAQSGANKLVEALADAQSRRLCSL
jgi:hypothetical protein